MCCLCATTAIEEARFLREDFSICLGDAVLASGCFDCSISGSGVFLDYKLTHIFIAALTFERQNAICKDSGTQRFEHATATNPSMYRVVEFRDVVGWNCLIFHNFIFYAGKYLFSFIHEHNVYMETDGR